MNPGELDREIVIEIKTAGKSGAGAPQETWGSPTTVWAKVTPLSGREYDSQAAAQIVAEETLVFTIRFRSDVRPGTARITYPVTGGRFYNIRRIAELGRQAFLDVTADTVTA